jgi:glyoxylate reductase
MNIFVTRTLPGGVLAPLDGLGDVVVSPHDRPLRPDELRAAVAGADAVITTLNDRVDAEVLTAAGPRLRIVANTAAGYDNLEVGAITAHGAVATNTPGVLTDATADLTMALLLALTRRVVEGDSLIRSGNAWSWDIGFMLGTGLRGKRLGIVGMGSIGQAVAERAAAFGMEIVYTSRRNRVAAGACVELPELLSTSDVVTLHCPLTTETRHLIDERALRSMKREAYLVNTARGAVVDEAALVRALVSGEIAGAAGLHGLGNVVLTPHLGSATSETRARMASIAVENVAAVLAGGVPLTPITTP